MAAYASQGGFHAQACYYCCQAAEKVRISSLGSSLGRKPPDAPYPG
jgi:hypothetical protein